MIWTRTCRCLGRRIELAVALCVAGASLCFAQQQLAEPFTPSARWSHYIHRTFGPARFAFLAVDTAIDHAFREPACWDSAAGSYGLRYARSIVRASRNQKYRRTDHRPPDRRGFAVPRVAVIPILGEGMERGARLCDGSDARWNKAARVHSLFRQRTYECVHGSLDQAAHSAGVVGTIYRMVDPRPGTDKPAE
jgi:hypothetical protein